MKEKGIIVKIKGASCIVLTKDGTYKKIPLAGRKNVRVGSQIEFTPVDWFGYLKPALMVASLLVVILGASLFQNLMLPEAFAYVSLDINPSMELAVTKDFKVISVNPMNQDAQKLLSDLDLKGTDIYSSVNTILAKSAQEGYLKPGQKNYILSTITVNNEIYSGSETPATLIYNNFAENIQASVTTENVDIELIVLSSNRSLRAEAHKQGLSPGKMVLFKSAVESGTKVSIKEVKDNSVTKLVDVYKVKLLPNNKKLIIKSVHIPPGQLKKLTKDGNNSKEREDGKDRKDREDDERDEQKKDYRNKPDKEIKEPVNGKNRKNSDETDDEDDTKPEKSKSEQNRKPDKEKPDTSSEERD